MFVYYQQLNQNQTDTSFCANTQYFVGLIGQVMYQYVNIISQLGFSIPIKVSSIFIDEYISIG